MERVFQQGFRKIIAWQEAHKLTLILYDVTRTFPKHEQYGVTSQLCRAASSIAAQIAEGSRMRTNDHRKIFYERAYGSAAEVDYFLQLSKELRYISIEHYKQLLEQINKTSYLTLQLIKSCI